MVDLWCTRTISGYILWSWTSCRHHDIISQSKHYFAFNTISVILCLLVFVTGKLDHAMQCVRIKLITTSMSFLWWFTVIFRKYLTENAFEINSFSGIFFYFQFRLFVQYSQVNKSFIWPDMRHQSICIFKSSMLDWNLYYCIFFLFQILFKSSECWILWH